MKLSHRLPTALPPMLPAQGEEVVAALLDELEQSIDEAERASESVRMRGGRIMAKMQHYKEAERHDWQSSCTLLPISVSYICCTFSRADQI